VFSVSDAMSKFFSLPLNSCPDAMSSFTRTCPDAMSSFTLLMFSHYRTRRSCDLDKERAPVKGLSLLLRFSESFEGLAFHVVG
jgi:hypothetical protein